MRRQSDLESRLEEWGREYGGGKYGASLGSPNSWLASMIKWRGRPPSGLSTSPDWTAADDVNEAIEYLAKQEKGLQPAQVIRVEYLLPGQPREAKRQKLARIGMQMGDVRYCQHLRFGKISIASWLRIPFSEPLREEEVVPMMEYMAGVD